MKKILCAVMATALVFGVSITSSAQGWQLNETGWWYGTNEDNSTWYASGWQWIDDNNDSIAECYCFAPNGYIYIDTITPDGYTVNSDGAWTVDGAVQTKTVSISDSGSENASSSNLSSSDLSSENNFDIEGTYYRISDIFDDPTRGDHYETFWDSPNQNFPITVTIIDEETLEVKSGKDIYDFFFLAAPTYIFKKIDENVYRYDYKQSTQAIYYESWDVYVDDITFTETSLIERLLATRKEDSTSYTETWTYVKE